MKNRYFAGWIGLVLGFTCVFLVGQVQEIRRAGGAGSLPTLNQLTNLVSATGSALDVWHGDASWGPVPAAGITALTNDVTASGTGSVGATLASVGTAGTYGDAGHFPVVTTDAKGRVTVVTTNALPAGGIVGTVITNGTAASPGDIAEFTTSTNVGKATSAHIQAAIGQVYQSTNAALTTLANNVGTNLTSLLPAAVQAVQTNATLASVGGAPLNSPAFTGGATIDGHTVLTNGQPSAGIGTIAISNMTAYAIPGMDGGSPPTMVPTDMTTNLLHLLVIALNNLTNWGKISTNASSLQVNASNVLSGGQLPIGTLAPTNGAAFQFLGFDGTERIWESIGIGLTNSGNTNIQVVPTLASLGTNSIQGTGPILLRNEVATTPSLGASGTNIVVDYSYRRLRLYTTTNMNISSFSNEAASGYGGGSLLKIFANGVNVTNNMSASCKTVIGNTYTFPLVITNGDYVAFSFDNSETGTNAVAIVYVH